MNFYNRIKKIYQHPTYILSVERQAYNQGQHDTREAAAEIAAKADRIIKEQGWTIHEQQITIEDLVKALEEVMKYTPDDDIIDCHGSKCREEWCEACFGAEEAEEAMREIGAATTKAQKALAKAQRL